MKSKKKASCLLAAFLASAALLTACGGGQTSSSEQSAAPSSSTTAAESTQPEGNAPDTGEDVTLKWATWIQKDYAPREEVFAKFNEELANYLPNTKVEFEIILGSDYKQKMDLKLAASEALDIMWTGYMFSYPEEVQKGSYLPLNDLLNQYGKDILNELPEFIIKKQEINGAIYSLPCYGTATFRGNGVFLSRDIVDKYMGGPDGLEALGRLNRASMYTTKECYDAFGKLLADVSAGGDMELGISNQTFRWLADKGLEGVNGEASPFVIKYFDNDLKIYNKYELENFKTMYETMSDFYGKGYIRKDILSVENPRSEDLKPGGTFLALHGYSHNGSVNSSRNTDFPCYLEPLDGYKFIPYDSTGNCTAIPFTAQNPERAMQLLNILNTSQGQDVYRLLSYGFEGEHYKFIGEDIVQPLTDSSNNKIYEQPWYTLGNMMMGYDTFEHERQYAEDYNNRALVSPLVGFKLDVSSISTEIAQIDALVKEFHDPLSTGALPNWEEKYNEFITKMNDSGSRKVIDEIQRQIDEYVAANRDEVDKRIKAYQDGWTTLSASEDKYIYEGYYVDDKASPPIKD